MVTMQHKVFCFRDFIKTESTTAVQRAFRLRLNIQLHSTATNCLACVEAPFIVKLSPSFLITLYIYEFL